MPEEPVPSPPPAPEDRPRHGEQPAVRPSAEPVPSHGADLAKLTGGVLTGLASQTVLLTAVLFYFGWVRSKATFDYFGVDISVLNFSVSDYVLRSVDAAFPLLAAIGLAALIAIAVHEQIRPGLVGRADYADRLGSAVSRTGAALAVAGLVIALVLRNPGEPAFIGPVIVLLGAAVAAYGFFLRGKYGSKGESSYLRAITGVILVAFLWTVTGYASYVGYQVGAEFVAGLPSAPNVTIYSADNLSLSGPGIKVSRISGPGAAYHFRYSGMRILVNSAGRLFLLPAGWRRGHGNVIVLPSAGNDNFRVEFSVPAS